MGNCNFTYKNGQRFKRKSSNDEEISTKSLDKNLIDRANAAGTFVDYGDSTNRQYNSNIDEIKNMDLTDTEKQSAYDTLYDLTTKQLEAEAQSLSPYSMGVGPARFDRNKMIRNADNAIEAREKTNTFMNNLRREQTKKTTEREQRALNTAVTNATNSGKLEFTHNGKSYFRTSKSSGTWREGNLNDYKAERKFTKSQQNLPFGERKTWRSLSEKEKRKYY